MSRRLPPLQHALNPLQSLIARRWRPQWICHTCKQIQPLRRSFLTTPANQNETEKPYYVTTPIFYVNAAPHVGHMYTMLLADVLKRWQELKGRKAILLTGTDEHGMKIQRAAAKARVDPKEFCDKGAEVFRTLAEQVELSNDIFIRTTDVKHKEGVEYAWQMLQDRGYIYESKHEGWYSVSDETFYPKGQVHLVVDPPTGRKIMASIETGKEVEWTSERNYHFRLSAFRDKLLEFYEANPEYIVPASRMKEVVAHVTAGLEDLSISRPTERLTWGVPVPTDSSQTIYVWLDALLNYATAVGYPFVPGKEGSGGWPADVQVVGKDIVRFHCIYWPAFLMALDLPLHKQVLTHAHWTIGRQKMAKSTGNGVNPFWALERFGIDVLRWYLIHEGGIADDADYDNSFIISKYKKTLQGGLGNLTSRVMRGKGWDVARAVKQNATPLRREMVAEIYDSAGKREYARLRAFPKMVDRLMKQLHPNHALREIMALVSCMNVYMQEAAPWSLVGGKTDELDRCIFLAAESLRLVGIMMQPFVPTSAARQLDMLGVAPERRTWEWAHIGKDDSYGIPFVPIGKGEDGVLFPRLTSDF